MRLQDDTRYRCARGLTILLCTGLLAGCGTFGSGFGGHDIARPSQQPTNGPQADYPMTIGEPYAINGVNYAPSDTLNYDEVGYLAAETAGVGYTGAHHTLPLPSYVEVTSLETGRTILVRLERRGPMQSNHLVALSPASMAQLEANAQTPVRVRRVNPPEAQRASLREGQSAPLRMDTPMSLVGVLKRNLQAQPAAQAAEAPVEVARAEPSPAPVSGNSTSTPPALRPLDQSGSGFDEAFAQAPQASSPPPTVRPSPEVTGGYVVQAAAFSTQARARSVASAIGGEVSQVGNLYRVRTGPFATRGQAEASLANVKAAGYTDARIFTNG